MIENFDDFRTLFFHKQLASAQRNAYKQHKTVEHLRGKVLIEVDFKQKIKIGMSPRQITAEFYDQQERTCFSLFGILFEKMFF